MRAAKGNYDEALNGMVAAYRAKRQPEIVQVNDARLPDDDPLGSHSSSAGGSHGREGAIKSTGPISLHPLSATYSKDGKVQAMPFNSSTPILFYNRGHFKAAGFEKPGETWQELEAQMDAIKGKGISKYVMALPATMNGASSKTTAP